jgi:uncharacterized protein (TIGR02246 family)
MSRPAANSSTCLLVIDLQAGFFELPLPLYRGDALLETVRGLLRRAREAGSLVVYVQHAGEAGGPFEPQSPGWRLHPSVAPEPRDVVVEKRHADAFAWTRLERVLRDAGVERLVVCGLATEGCVDTTVRRARSLGFSVDVADDAHSTTDGPVLTAEQTIRHHNAVFRIFANVTPAADIRFTPGEVTSSNPDRAAVIRSLRDWLASAEAGDSDHYVSFLTDDGVILSQGVPTVSGKPAALAAIRAFVARFTLTFEELETQDVRVSGDMALHRYTIVTVQHPKVGGPPVRIRQRYLDVLQRECDGQWRVSHHMFNTAG